MFSSTTTKDQEGRITKVEIEITMEDMVPRFELHQAFVTLIEATPAAMGLESYQGVLSEAFDIAKNRRH
jgi:hypothetical protein